MIASLLSPAAANPPGSGRISQLLPAVKCSTCHQPVPLSELGDHTCTAPPAVPGLPKPSVTHAAATALLPQRLQGRVASTTIPVASSSRQDPAQHQRMESSASARLRINTRGPGSPTQASFQPRPSPLARSGSDRQDTSSPRPRDPFPSSSPLRTRQPETRMRTPSYAGSIQSTPSTARPPLSFNQQISPVQTGPPPHRNGSPFSNAPMNPNRSPSPHVPSPRNGPPPPINEFPFPTGNRGPPPAGYNDPPPPGASMGFPPRQGPPGNMGPPGGMGPPNGMDPRNMGRPGSNMSMGPGSIFPPGGMGNNRPGTPDEAFVPPAERGIDTKSGGAAGMAGVGRRGFAAAARAAMFVAPTDTPGGPQPQYNRRPNAPQFLDIEGLSRSTSTPPLSAGSGYSSLSPGPTSPLQQSEFTRQAVPNSLQRTPSPSAPYMSTPTPVLPTKPSTPPPASAQSTSNMSIASPLSGRLPFFEKFKNKLPGMSPATETTPPNANFTNEPTNNNLPDSNSTLITRPRADTSTSTSSRGGPAMPSRSISSSTDASRRRREANGPTSPMDSESEYGGLAYADSTDYEDNDEEPSKGRKGTPPPPLPLTSILRSGSNASSRIQFGSVSGRSNRSVERGDDRTGIRFGNKSGHSRDNSASSYSSVSSSGDREHLTRARANSSAIAHALGLSQTPPSEYAKLGGPGINNIGARVGRSVSESSSGSGSKSAYSRGTNVPQAAGEKTLETLLEDANASGTIGLTKSKSTGKQRSFGSSSGDGSVLRRGDTITSKASREDESILGSVGRSKAQRSNTVKGVQSPDVKPIKLPTRSLTSPQFERDQALDMMKIKKERVKKLKVCLRCQKSIDNGRWVSVDNGGVLCEKCWKNMYLPKCRRCNLPIERQAVSSSDGQLKGKYHKECFNCHTCHKPFPDKTFYVYDGKPLCAYHYHEANDSLCAAALCGQPIEGPCAVSHNGDRYHPEHMTCEYPGYPECHERLNEYWEVDGRMLCEHHALYASKNESDEEGEERWAKSSRAMKRVTRFIDLAGAGGLGAPVGAGAAGAGAGAGGGRDSVDGSELR